MMKFSNKCVSISTIHDIPFLLPLLNQAYRGETSKQGWTTEAHLIAGDVRTNEKTLRQTLGMHDSVILKYTNEHNEIIGCVNLQRHDDKIYLGMLAVFPNLQGGGTGNQLLIAAEEYARSLQRHSIYMTVISLRTELINWYIRHGYHDTGKRKAFDEDSITGKHLQPLEFMVMEKKV